MPRNQENPGKKEAAACRRVKALEYRKRGHSYRAIGRKLGVSEAQAHRDVMAVLRKLAEQEKGLAVELRQLESDRLNLMLTKLKPAIDAGDPQAVAVAIRIGERRAKLFGMDAPERLDLGNADGVPFKVYQAIDTDKV